MRIANRHPGLHCTRRAKLALPISGDRRRHVRRRRLRGRRHRRRRRAHRRRCCPTSAPTPCSTIRDCRSRAPANRGRCRTPSASACRACRLRRNHDCRPRRPALPASRLPRSRPARSRGCGNVTALDRLATGVGAAAKRIPRCGVARLSAAVLLGDALVAIRHGAAMVGVVVPVAVRDVGAVEVVVAIDVDVDVAAAPVAIAPQRAADDDAGGEAEQRAAVGIVAIAGRIPVIRRVRRIRPCAVHHGRVVRRHVDDFGIGRLDLDDRGAVLHFRRDLLLLGVLERALRDGLGAQRLRGRHHFLLLRQEGVAELLRPVELLAHHRQHLRKHGERLDRRVPGLALQRVFQRLALEARVRLHPPLRGDDFERIRRRHQHLREKRVRIERDGREQLVELFLRERFGGGGRRRGGRCGGRRWWRLCRQRHRKRETQRACDHRSETEAHHVFTVNSIAPADYITLQTKAMRCIPQWRRALRRTRRRPCGRSRILYWRRIRFVRHPVGKRSERAQFLPVCAAYTGGIFFASRLLLTCRAARRRHSEEHDK